MRGGAAKGQIFLALFAKDGQRSEEYILAVAMMCHQSGGVLRFMNQISMPVVSNGRGAFRFSCAVTAL